MPKNHIATNNIIYGNVILYTYDFSTVKHVLYITLINTSAQKFHHKNIKFCKNQQHYA
jgi:hypothetical protein